MAFITSLLRSVLVAVLALAFVFAPPAAGHTWIEQLMVISPNGTLVGQPGFARGNILRGSPGFSDPTMVNLIPPDGRANEVLPTDLMCKSSQTSQVQTDGSPRLQAAPGSAIALRFQENGHVTLPDNQPGKPPNRGTVFVYGTTNPSPDDAFLAIHRVWNADGTGGDGRGVLLSTRNFDDGQCYQVNGGQISQQRQKEFAHPASTLMGSDLWCQQDIQLPSTAPSGKPYTLYWVWDWPTLPGAPGLPNGKQEIYTTCMDIDIVDAAGAGAGAGAESKFQAAFAQGQPLDNAAVAGQLTDIANPTAVTGSTLPFDASATGPVAGGASQAIASAATAPDTGVPAYLTAHSVFTAGPAAETQGSIIPIGATGPPATQAPQAQPTGVAPNNAQPQPTGNSNGGGGFRGGFGGNGRGSTGGGNGGSVSGFSNDNDTGNGNATVPPAPGSTLTDAGADVATVTEYESVTETIMHTVYATQFTKRDGESFSSPIVASDSRPTPSPSLRAVAVGSRRGSVCRGTALNHPCAGDPVGVLNATTIGDDGRSHSHQTPELPQVIPTVFPTDPVVTMPLEPSPITTVVAVERIAPRLSTLTSSTASAPAPTPAPAMVPRAAAAAAAASVDHNVFRLRARNPFVMLGDWLADREPTTTA